MTEQKQVYKCNLCGNITEVLSIGAGELVCCGQPMELMQSKTEDIGQEKHLPIIKKIENGIAVEVGSILHPMEEKHHIQWIEVIVDKLSCKKLLNSNDKPIAKFNLKSEKMKVKAFCNIHGLWEVKI